MNPGTTAREERNAGVSESSAGRRGLVAVDDASLETGFSRTAPVHPGIHTQGQDKDEAKQKGQSNKMATIRLGGGILSILGFCRLPQNSTTLHLCNIHKSIK